MSIAAQNAANGNVRAMREKQMSGAQGDYSRQQQACKESSSSMGIEQHQQGKQLSRCLRPDAPCAHADALSMHGRLLGFFSCEWESLGTAG